MTAKDKKAPAVAGASMNEVDSFRIPLHKNSDFQRNTQAPCASCVRFAYCGYPFFLSCLRNRSFVKHGYWREYNEN